MNNFSYKLEKSHNPSMGLIVLQADQRIELDARRQFEPEVNPNHHDTVGATACLSPASNLLILNAALVFGANISPPEFAIYADAKSAIADFLVTPRANNIFSKPLTSSRLSPGFHIPTRQPGSLQLRQTRGIKEYCTEIKTAFSIGGSKQTPRSWTIPLTPR